MWNSCEIKVPQKFYLIVALPTTAGQLILQKNQPVKLLKQHINEYCLCLKEKGTAVSSVVSLFFSLPCQRQYRQICCTSLITNWTNIQMNGHAPLWTALWVFFPLHLPSVTSKDGMGKSDSMPPVVPGCRHISENAHNIMGEPTAEDRPVQYTTEVHKLIGNTKSNHILEQQPVGN